MLVPMKESDARYDRKHNDTLTRSRHPGQIRIKAFRLLPEKVL